MRVIVTFKKQYSKEHCINNLRGSKEPYNEVVDCTDAMPDDPPEGAMLLLAHKTEKVTTITVEADYKRLEQILKAGEKEKASFTAKVDLSENLTIVDCKKTVTKSDVQSCSSVLPGVIHPTQETDEITITGEMVADYREDIKDLGTYSNEAEAALMAERLDISFVIFSETGDDTIEPVLTIGNAPDAQLLHRYNHYVVLVRDDDNGTLTVADTDPAQKYRESATRTRADGSCLLDGCHIIATDAAASNEQITEYRTWLSARMPEDMIRGTLTTVLIDAARGIFVPGLGSRTQEHYNATFPRRGRRYGIEGSPYPLVVATASCALLQKMNEYEHALRISKLRPEKQEEQPKRGAPKKKKKEPEVVEEPSNKLEAAITAQEIITALGLEESEAYTLDLGDVVDEYGSYLIVASCECQKCLWAAVELTIWPTALPSDDQVVALFGTEFTFTNKTICDAAREQGEDVVATDANSKAQRDWQSLVTKNPFPEMAGAVEKVETEETISFKITYKDHWWYAVSLDVSCVELQAAPLTLEDARRMRDRLQNDIFGFAGGKDLRLAPHYFYGGGHIHLGLSYTFGEDALLFRNFIVDLCNHPLAMEVLDNDPINSPVLAQLGSGQRDAFAKVLRETGPAFLAENGGEALIMSFCGRLRNEVYTACNHPDFDTPAKLQAINVERIQDKVKPHARTLEIRNIRAQRSADEFILIAELLQARLNHVKGLCHRGKSAYLIPYDNKVRGNTKSNAKTIAEEWTKFVTDCGLPAKPYTDLMNSNLAERQDSDFA